MVTTAHMPGFLDYSIGAQCHCGLAVGPGKPLEAIFSACSPLINAPLFGLFLKLQSDGNRWCGLVWPGGWSQMAVRVCVGP